MKNTPKILLVNLTLILSMAGCGVITGQDSSSSLTASGTIEAETVHLAPEASGKISEILVDQGDTVEAGQVVFRLDDAALQAQRRQAEAVLATAQAAQSSAQANLDLLNAGSTEEQIQAAQAQLDSASANQAAIQATIDNLVGDTRPEEISAAQIRLDLARNTYETLVVSLTTQQVADVKSAMEQARSSLANRKAYAESIEGSTRISTNAKEAATTAVEDSQKVLDAAEFAYKLVSEGQAPFAEMIEAVHTTWNTAELALSQAEARQTSLEADEDMLEEVLNAAEDAVNDAADVVDETENAYDSLSSGDQANLLDQAWDDLTSAQDDLNALGRTSSGSTNLETLLNQLDAAAAQVDAAQANLDTILNGARTEQIMAAQGQVDSATGQIAAAQAALDLVDVQLDKMSVSSPISGVVLVRGLNLGEMASPGASVVELGGLDPLKLTVYVSENQYGKILLGQTVQISVDSYPDSIFTGIVTYISDEAEFTPRNVQTVDSRSSTVFAVEISIANPDLKLKPGMPADATFVMTDGQ